jgi:D-3-phosphoglycerate dehydrogenase
MQLFQDVATLSIHSSLIERTRSMSQTVDILILDLLEWIGPGRRPYRETMEAWRTSCPRLPVWEDATDAGFIERHHERGGVALVSVSASGAEHLRRHRRA